MITFKAKIREKQVIEQGNIVLKKYVKIPKLTQSHCDMNKFRTHPKHRDYANSDLFENILNNRIKPAIFGIHSNILLLDSVPNNVTVDTSGFLSVVTINEV